MKKKLTAILLSAVMALSVAACSKEPEKEVTAEVTAAEFYAQAEAEICDALAKISESENYLELYNSDIEDNEFYELCKGVSKDSKGTVYGMELNDELFDGISEELGAKFSLDDLNDFEKEYILKRVWSALPNFFTGKLGVNAIVLSSIVSYGKTFVTKADVPDSFHIVSTDKENVYIWVTYVNAGDGAVNVSAVYFPTGKDGLDMVKELFGDKLEVIE